MIADFLEGILDAILGVFVFFAIVALHLISLVTLPLWIIPYKLWKRERR